MIPLEIHPDAQREFIEAVVYLQERNPQAATNFGQAYRAIRRSVQTTPSIYRPRTGEVCRASFSTPFKHYYLAFFIWNEKIVILAVAHSSRHPHYFLDRVTTAKQMF